ncbi:uncharacterized protein LOC130998187 [Salvia miltiorrhiza]|uniref:uncharacterized protein LOC130998187 n=1 Tax=Salvia miltiorrhiza TaxID=226208 RepID=UPI0025AD0880|nr:uncharacterized protein LOC130998187 [Salvia miltiorrhiza]
MASSSLSITTPIFNGENYDYWSVRMKTCLESHDLWDVIEEGITMPGEDIDKTSSSEVRKKLKQQNAKALYLLQQSVSDSIMARIIRATTAKEAWDILKEEFQGNVKVRTIKLQSLRRELENLKMKDSEAAKDYFSRIMEIINQMRSYGENVSDERIIQKVLISLTEKYDPVVAAIEESKDLSKMPVAELMGSLEAHEQRLSRRHESSLESAFQSKLNVRGNKSRNGGTFKTNHKEGSSSNKESKRRTAIIEESHSAKTAKGSGTWKKIAEIEEIIKPTIQKIK